MLSGLSIFFPTYNEEGNIRKCVTDSLEQARKIAHKYEVIVVLAKGSSDNTENIVKEMMQKNRRIRLVYQEIRDKGYGYALRLGIAHSRYPYIFYADSDNQYDLKEMPKLVPYLKDYHVVSGYRLTRNDAVVRRLMAFTYNVILELLFKTGVRDIDSAFKFYKKEIFDKVELKFGSGIVDAEIIIKAKRHGFKIKEIGVHHHKRASGTAMYETSNLGFMKPSVVGRIIIDIWRLLRDVNGQEWKYQ